MDMPMMDLEELRLDLNRDPGRHRDLPIASHRLGERLWEGWLHRGTPPHRRASIR
jgi:hypothetical protein